MPHFIANCDYVFITVPVSNAFCGWWWCVRSFVRSLPSSLDSCLSIVCEDINILMTVYRGFIGDDNNNNNNTIM